MSKNQNIRRNENYKSFSKKLKMNTKIVNVLVSFR